MIKKFSLLIILVFTNSYYLTACSYPRLGNTIEQNIINDSEKVVQNPQPTVESISLASPDGSYLIENYGMNNNITAGGLYPSEGIHLVNILSGKVIWDKTPGYYDYIFLWSEDSQYLAITSIAREYSFTYILKIDDLSEITVPIPDEMQKQMRDYRPDPRFDAAEWKNNDTLIVSFQWVGKDEKTYNGSLDFNASNGEINNCYYAED